MSQSVLIIADFREKPSGIPTLLSQKGLSVNFSQLKTGDYLINNEIVVERKSAEDFIQSLLSGRLFNQCSKLVRLSLRTLLIIEGNPYQTNHQIDKRAVKGAVLSILTSWQIPLIYSKNKEDSADILLMLSKQSLPKSHLLSFNSYKPKRIKNHRYKFIQYLPGVGAKTAYALLEYFGGIETIMNADAKTLQRVKGVGKVTAEKIRKFLSVKI